MEQLQEIAQESLVLSQNALARLDLCLETQRRLHESGCPDQCLSDKSSTNMAQYYKFIGQSYSLYTKAQKLSDSVILSNSESLSSVQHAIDNLIQEFQEVANDEENLILQSIKGSPNSISLQSPCSFQPKPLKILQRRQAQNESPTKKTSCPSKLASDNEGFEVNLAATSGHLHDRLLGSSPSSIHFFRPPHTKADTLFIRSAKSCDAGLNTRSNPHENRLNFFKDRQRLSISFIEDEEDLSDEATVISVSSLQPAYIFETDIKSPPSKSQSGEKCIDIQGVECPGPGNKGKSFISLLSATPSAPQIGITEVDYKPNFGFGYQPGVERKASQSKKMLTQLVSQEHKTKRKHWLNECDGLGKPISNTLKLLNNLVLVTSETGLRSVNGTTSAKLLIPPRKLKERKQASHGSCSILVHGSSRSKFVTAPQHTKLHFKVSHGALQEALNTDLDFK
ncbi:LAQU0S15e00144g1_1 [Lachancea quebecensis]|uniref:LAQU0S15e00144g1_1 n=1 Tax=Lachancea quebecensis TaxID=1654605 RepID=A0A0P1KXY0_9SACH|nr:LAQU0S15e00144g1_1 [Lachancea quebecensis]